MPSETKERPNYPMGVMAPFADPDEERAEGHSDWWKGVVTTRDRETATTFIIKSRGILPQNWICTYCTEQ